MQPDPIGYGDGLNLYAYAGNDPINGRDPSGQFVECEFYQSPIFDPTEGQKLYDDCRGSQGAYKISDQGLSENVWLYGVRLFTQAALNLFNEEGDRARAARKEAGGQKEGALITIGYTNILSGENRDRLVPFVHHAVIIATDLKSGTQYATRAGPGGGADGSFLWSEARPYRQSTDYGQVRSHQNVGVSSLNGEGVFQRMQTFSAWNNSHPTPYQNTTTNSNAYAFSFVESLGFPRPNPSVLVPGHQVQIGPEFGP